MNNGVTLAHFQSPGNIPETKALLKRSHSETEIRSAHSCIILAETLSSPVALDLGNLFRCKKTMLNLLLFTFILLVLLIAIGGISLATLGPAVEKLN